MSEQKTSNLTLEIYPRVGTGKNAAFRTRASNLIPAIVYGPKIGKAAKGSNATNNQGVAVCLESRNFLQVYGVKGRTTLIDLALKEGAPAELAGSKVLIKELQTHSLKRQVMHVDMFQLDLTQSIRVSVPLKFTGKAKGLAEGGILSILSRKVEIKCLPTDIPHEIEVDVTDLDLNDSLHVHQLADKLKENKAAKYEFIFENDFTLCAVVPPEEEKAATPVAADAAAAGAPAAAGAAAPAAAAAKGAAPAAAAPAAKGAKK